MFLSLLGLYFPFFFFFLFCAHTHVSGFLAQLSPKEDSNEGEVLAILEALRCFSRFSQDKLVVKSDSANLVKWISENVGLGGSDLCSIRSKIFPPF